jgi:hypothetical protein
MQPERSARSSLPTVVAIAITAYAACDLVHEVAGHGLAALLIPGVRVLSLSTVALQTTGDSRTVAACGTIANIVAGLVATGVFRRASRFSNATYFCWLFGSLNLLDGCGYPLYSAVLGSGDWEAVVRGWEPAWLWRAALGVLGAAAYWAAAVLAASALARAVREGLVARAETVRLVFPAYVAGGLLLIVASAFNPISSSLILLSGVSSGFAAMAGLTLVPRMVEVRTDGSAGGTGSVTTSVGWMVAGAIVGAGFVGVLGPGLTFASASALQSVSSTDPSMSRQRAVVVDLRAAARLRRRRALR